MKIGYFQTAFLGDLLLSIPTLRRVKKLYPDCELHIFCRQAFKNYMESLPFVDEVFGVEKKLITSRKSFSKKLKSNAYDIFLCPHMSPRTHLWIKRVKSPLKIGFENIWNAIFFHKRVRKNLHWPEALRQMQLLAPLDPLLKADLENLSEKSLPFKEIPGFSSMALEKNFWETEFENNFPAMESQFICLAPGSVWNTKRWSEHGFAQVAKRFLSAEFAVIFIGSPDEADLCEDISSLSGGISLAGSLSLWQTQVLLSKAQLLVANDSGASHMASVAGIPCVSVFGPTTQDLGFQPWNPQARVVENSLSCRPCGKHGHNQCPIGTHECMQSISEEQVMIQANLFFDQLEI